MYLSSFYKAIFCIFILTLSWGSVFSLAPVFPIYIVSLAILFSLGCLLILSKKKIVIPWHLEDVLLLIFFMTIFLISLFNHNEKTFNYLVTYLIAFFVCILMLPLFLCNLRSIPFLKINYYAFFLISTFLIIEFVLNNIIESRVLSSISGYQGLAAIYPLGSSLFFRSYGMAFEPGYVSFYYVCLGPLAIWYSRKYSKKNTYLIFLALNSLGFLTLFSAGGLGMITFSYVIYSINKVIYQKKYIFVFKVAALLSVLVILLNTNIFSGIYSKLTLNYKTEASSGSASERMYRWHRDWEDFTTNHFWVGEGLGSSSAIKGQGSSTNWYLFLANETGIFPIIFILLFFIFKYVRFVRFCFRNDKGIFIMGYVGGLAYFMIISTIQILYLWVLIAFISSLIHTETYKKSNDFKRSILNI